MHSAAAVYKDDDERNFTWPLALLDLHSWGAGQANNVLDDYSLRLEPNIAKALPELEKSILRKMAGGQVKPVDDRRWNILSTYFKPLPDGAQGVLRTDIWLTRRLESAFAGWVDSHLSIASSVNSKDKASEPAPKPPAAAAADSQAAARPAKPAYYHYLEPAPDAYRKITEDAQKLIQELSAIGYFQEKSRERFQDFIRLTQRLEQIATAELTGQALPYPDLKLLGSIDQVLDKVVVPLTGVLPISPPSSVTTGGVNFGLGRPGLAYVILQPGLKTVLGRGAVYTYYEMSGPPLSAVQWQRKLDSGQVRPPFWADKFDLVQPPVAKK